MKMNISSEPSLQRRNPLPHGDNPIRWATAGAVLEFGRFRVLVRPRQLLADGVPVDLGARAFDLLMLLLEADGALVAKEELLKNVWRGILVSECNLKVQVSALRKALGPDRDLVRTETGRGYRFIGKLKSSASRESAKRPSQRKPSRRRSWCYQNCRYAFRTCQFDCAPSTEGLPISHTEDRHCDGEA